MSRVGRSMSALAAVGRFGACAAGDDPTSSTAFVAANDYVAVADVRAVVVDR